MNLLKKALTLLLALNFLFTVTVGNCLYAAPKPKLLSAGIAGEEVSTTNKDKIYNLMKTKFSSSGKVVIIQEATAQKYIDGYFNTIAKKENKTAIDTAMTNFIKGKKEYDYAKFGDAINSLKISIDLYSKYFEFIRDNKDFLEANLYLALSLIATDDPTNAKLVFENIFKYDNEYILDSKKVPPKVVQLFSRIKKDISIYDRTTIRVKSNPDDVKIYFNGKYIGEARSNIPVLIPKVLPGRHHLLAEKNGYKTQYKTFVTNKGEITIETNLEKSNPQELFQPFALSPSQDFLTIVEKLSKESSLNPQLVLLSSIVKEGIDYKLKGQLYDIRTGVFTKSFKAKIGRNLKLPGNAVDNLSKILISHIDSAGMLKENPVKSEKSEPQKAVSADDSLNDESEDLFGEEKETEAGFEEKPKLKPNTEFYPGSKISNMESEDIVNLDTKKAVAWVVLALLLVGAGVGGYFLYQGTTGDASVSIYAPE
ncbi:MAG: PEGA domain-containing protein [Pseudomonadota bacterium]